MNSTWFGNKKKAIDKVETIISFLQSMLFDADKNIVSITKDGFKVQQIETDGDVYEYKFVIEGLKVLQFVKSKQNIKFKKIDSYDLPTESR